MESDTLSLEGYGVLLIGRDISIYLEKELSYLLEASRDEDNYLLKAFYYVKGLYKEQAHFLDEWLLDNRIEEEKLKALLFYIKEVQSIPIRRRTMQNPVVLTIENETNLSSNYN